VNLSRSRENGDDGEIVDVEAVRIVDFVVHKGGVK